VVTEPFLHTGYGHLMSNTIAFVLIGWVLLLSGVRAWLTVTAIVVVVSGALTWLVAPHGLVVGADSLIFGWLGYLLARAYFSRRLKWIITAVAVLFFFGTLLFSLLPSFTNTVHWEAHVCGFLAGVAAGAVLHPRRRGEPKAQPPPGPAVS
jgi:membrane associated rhomboid family serine protease